MKNEYLNIYNNLIKLTRNKLLFEKITSEDSFSHRLMVFLFHFAFFLKVYKKNNTKKLKFFQNLSMWAQKLFFLSITLKNIEYF